MSPRKIYWGVLVILLALFTVYVNTAAANTIMVYIATGFILLWAVAPAIIYRWLG